MMRAPDEPFAHFVRRLLVRRSWKDKQLAAASGVPANTLSAVLGGRPPSWPVAERIMDALGVRLICVEDEPAGGLDPEDLGRIVDIVVEQLRARKDGSKSAGPTDRAGESWQRSAS